MIVALIGFLNVGEAGNELPEWGGQNANHTVVERRLGRKYVFSKICKPEIVIDLELRMETRRVVITIKLVGSS